MGRRIGDPSLVGGGSVTGGSWTGVRDGSTSDGALLWSGESAERGDEEGVTAFLPLPLPRPPLPSFFILPRPLLAVEEAPAAAVCILFSSALQRGWAGIMEPPLPVALAGGSGRSGPLPTNLSTPAMMIRPQRIYNFLLFHAIILSILDVLYAILHDFWD